MDENNIIQIINADEICRACLSEGELQPIYITKIEDHHLTLSEMLMACASVRASEGDGLPSKMCIGCISQINQAFSFKRQCEESDATLRLYLFNRMSTKQEIPFTDDVKKEIKVESEGQSEGRNEVDDEIIVEYDNPYDLNETSPNENNRDHQKNDSVVQIAKRKKDEKAKRRRTSGMKKNLNECINCKLQFETRTEYLDHVRNKKHQRQCYTCSVCNKSFTGYRLKEHMRIHTQEKPYTCDVCGSQFSLSRNLRRHTMIHTGERPHKCQFCDKAFNQSTALAVHLRTHTGETPFVCNICGKKFRHSVQLTLHIRKHELNDTDNKHPKQTQNYPMPNCKICSKSFSTNSCLNTHMLIHGPKKFLCSHCGKGFSRKPGLQCHMKTHTGEKPYPCQTCGKSFSQIGTLKAHQLIHTGEKPYICRVCDKSFKQKNQLTYHVRIHSGEKPYTCSVCDKSFSLKGNMTVHMRTHTGETPYVCPVCEKGFYDSSSMKKHWRNHKIGDNCKT